MAKNATKWLPLFKRYIKAIRIISKHAESDPDGTGIELKLWTSQTRVLEQICDGLENGIHVFYILKSRQLGITTITLAITLFWLALHPNTIGIFVSENDQSSNKNRTTIRKYVASLASFMGKSFSIARDNRFGFEFSNGSRLDMRVAGKSKVNWGEGEGYIVGHLCVAKGTPVVLEHGRIKAIEEVVVGDRVLTHTGASANVIDVMGQPNHNGPMMRITPWLGQQVTCSPDHTIPTQRGIIEARELRSTDRLVMPLRMITDDVKEVVIPIQPGRSGRYEVGSDGRFAKSGQGLEVREREPWVNVVSPGSGATIPLTEEIGFAIGYYLAEGSIVWQSGTRIPAGITFTRHRTEKDFADRAIDALSPFITGKRRLTDRKGSLTSQDSIYGTPLAKWVNDHFGSTDEKFIPDEVFSWGEDFCRGLLCGILSGDGSKTEAFAQGYATNTMVMPSTRPSLSMQVRDIAAALGYGWGAIRYKAAGQHYSRNCKADWRLMWFGAAAAGLRELIGLPVQPGGHKLGEKYIVQDGSIYMKIRKIEYGFDEPEMWDISVDHPDHTFRTPWFAIGNTEVQRYGKEEGLESFRHAMAPDNPRSLYIYEGTAAGDNHWKDMVETAQADEFSSRFLFVGWWSHDRQKIRMSDPKWKAFGVQPPSPEENDLIAEVRQEYNYEISMEQLAWYRWQQTIPGSSEDSLAQNQPWTARMAFVQSGTSFFQNRLILKRKEEIHEANDKTEGGGIEDGGFGFKVYQFYLADEYHLSKVEPITTAIPKEQIQLRVWELPNPEGIYVIGVDPAGGRSEENNSHCCSVWRCFADKMVQVAEWADSLPETRHCAWVTAYLAGQYQNCRINIDLTGGIGSAIMQAFDDLRARMRSDLYQEEVRKYAEKQMAENALRREAETGERPTLGHNGGPKWEFDDFLPAASWYLYRRIDSPGPGFMFNTKLGTDLKFRMMNILRDSWVTNLLEIRSIPLLDEMEDVVQTRGDIGASAPGRKRDDRTFAMALANQTWIENLRGGLISQGITWEGTKLKESGEISPLADRLNRRVFSILKAFDEAADLPPPKTFFEQRGL